MNTPTSSEVTPGLVSNDLVSLHKTMLETNQNIRDARSTLGLLSSSIKTLTENYTRVLTTSEAAVAHLELALSLKDAIESVDNDGANPEDKPAEEPMTKSVKGESCKPEACNHTGVGAVDPKALTEPLSTAIPASVNQESFKPAMCNQMTVEVVDLRRPTQPTPKVITASVNREYYKPETFNYTGTVDRFVSNQGTYPQAPLYFDYQGIPNIPGTPLFELQYPITVPNKNKKRKLAPAPPPEEEASFDAVRALFKRIPDVVIDENGNRTNLFPAPRSILFKDVRTD
ncbi:hypothetical protein BDN72DRAFT_905367 [Pluteus cervinus]|uniref:Uncharacterized protein n=1 Tax=Pluteus cervinus TaxID=181527 RepID=A0ACD3A3I6_9AGAR|nr:hypothetical protein BDN72DRAFT_905367 [Pluteus cervinus]